MEVYEVCNLKKPRMACLCGNEVKSWEDGYILTSLVSSREYVSGQKKNRMQSPFRLEASEIETRRLQAIRVQQHESSNYLC